MTTYIILPTYLYIKQHSITGLKYFGKTTKDPLKYNGSGVHWTRHIKQHGKEHIITTWVSEPYIDSIAISEFALSFSRDNNIVESKDWANIIPENGLDGGFNMTGRTHSTKTKQKISDAKKGKTHSIESKQKMSAAQKGRTHSTKTKQKMSAVNKGKIHSIESKQKMSDIKKGKIHSIESKQKISAVHLGVPQLKVTCPHCGKTGGNIMKRYHFDNCKKKNYLTGTNKIALSPSSLP
jgi:hypothetical protein